MKRMDRMTKEVEPVRTDLAIEAKNMFSSYEKDKDKIPGVTSNERTVDDIRINRITVSQAGEETIQKKVVTYITIFADGVKTQDTKIQGNASKVLAKELIYIMNQNNVKPIDKG